MKSSRIWLVANILLPLTALTVVSVVAVCFVSARQNALTDRQILLAHLVVDVAAANDVLPESGELARLVQVDPTVVPEVKVGEPETVVATSFDPSECAELWIDAVPPTLSVERWGSTSSEGIVLGVATRAQLYADRPTARAVFERLGVLLGSCTTVTLRTIETSAQRTDESAARAIETSAGIPGYKVETRTSFALDNDVQQGWHGVTRYYFVGNAIFEFRYWYDAATGAPSWADAESALFEQRIGDLLSSTG
ncbi:MAG: hypothetical protein ABI435_00325 [Pseudolysinimonas sp.]